ncbi:MAG: glycoside hydrolase family 3 N-terminal domain-containing protein, partial [Candidatus Promineifilaceae bacterium]|nr:glycoside hydrolase family 3 N-terminal domain-containing protein [Candidatus Promineifilaceae bacterium]
MAERVGQLFLITFRGREVGRNDPITDLVLNYKVGGLVLLANNDNIGGAEGTTPQQVAELTNQLQMVSTIGERAFITDTVRGDDRLPAPTLPATGTQIPLFIATQHEGDGPPYSQIYSGLTEIPSAMAIGATWQPDLAEDVGQVVGRELAALGINFLLGPSLDVLESPSPESPGDLGIRSFGGDPY